jgi:signal transduction histidine kinase
MALNRNRSIKVPIVLGAITVVLALALMVGWILVIFRNIDLSKQVVANHWLMAGGVVSIVVIVTVLVLFSVFLVREALEGRRQVGFIDSVTHELKSPLASLKLAVQTLDRRELSAEQRRQLHQMMLDDVDRLTAFIDDILVASRLGHGPGDASVTNVALRDLAERVAERVSQRQRVPTEAITLRVDAGLRMMTEQTTLEIILQNLLDNAVKYSNEPVRVELSVEVLPTGRLEFTVRDQGIGIPPHLIGLIFDRFYRVPSEAVRARRGTGIGLYVASSLVKNLGGTLTAQSAGPGAGTTFSFAIPLR